MKKGFLFSFFITITLIISAQNVDEILTKFELANGGLPAFSKLKTIQYTSVLKLNMMGMPIDITMKNIIENGKLFRKETSGMMGMKGSYTIVTDTSGFVSTPSVPSYGDFPGMEGGIAKLEPDVLLKSQEKLDILQEFSPLINYKTKGFKIEYLGTSKIDKVDCYKLKVVSNTGDQSVYFINQQTYLTKQIELPGKQFISQMGLDTGPMANMMGSKIDKQKVIIIYAEYRDIDGIQFPIKQIIQLGSVDIEIENSDVQINEPIEKKYYLTK